MGDPFFSGDRFGPSSSRAYRRGRHRNRFHSSQAGHFTRSVFIFRHGALSSLLSFSSISLSPTVVVGIRSLVAAVSEILSRSGLYRVIHGLTFTKIFSSIQALLPKSAGQILDGLATIAGQDPCASFFHVRFTGYSD